jgi:C-terminal processing protease CtpA/Prc
MRDSTRARGASFGAEIERVAIQLLSARQMQLEAQQALTALTSGQIADASRAQVEAAARRFRQQLEQASRQSQTLRTQLAALCDRNAKPQGYMGITFSATMRAEAEGSGAEIFRFAENPTVETVEPGSPAEHAGVAKGDEIILIGGQQVVGRDIVFARLLRPGNRLPIRVRRSGDTRDVLLVVGERPPSLDNGCPFLDARIMAAFGDQFTVTPMPAVAGGFVRSGAAPSTATIVRRAPLPPGEAPTPVPSQSPRAVGGTITLAPPAPMVPPVPGSTPGIPAEARASEAARVFVFSGGSTAPMTIAGATIVRTNADLRETFGVKSGVLVLDVARGTPAYTSGLKGGDVIVSAGRLMVTSPLSIQRAIENADGNEVALRIIRKKKEQALVLRW